MACKPHNYHHEALISKTETILRQRMVLVRHAGGDRNTCVIV
jgi:hypothetical protein